MSCIGTVCLLAAQLTSLEVGYNNQLNKLATTYDGTTHDVSRFYNDKQTNINIGGRIALDSDTLIDINYNNGIKTDKYELNDSYNINITQQLNDSLSISGSFGLQGGHNHTPCTDSYNRQYYCSELTAWSDMENTYEKDNYNISLNINYNF